jgi:hypothetical protein
VIDIDQVEAGIAHLVAVAIDAVTSLEELVDVAQAAAVVGTPELLEAVATKLGEHVAMAEGSAGAWAAELTYSKIDAWAHTGHRARLLAEAWGHIAPPLRAARGGG